MTAIQKSLLYAFDKTQNTKHKTESVLDKLISMIKHMLNGDIDETEAGLSIRKSILEALMTCKHSTENELVLKYDIMGTSNHKLSVSKSGDEIVIRITENGRFFPENIKVKTIKITEINKYWSILKKAEMGKDKYQQIDKIVNGLNSCFEGKSIREVYADFANNNSDGFKIYISNLSKKEQTKLLTIIESPEAEAGQDELMPLAKFYFTENKASRDVFNNAKCFAQDKDFNSTSIEADTKLYCFIANNTKRQAFNVDELPETIARIIIDCSASLE